MESQHGVPKPDAAVATDRRRVLTPSPQLFEHADHVAHLLGTQGCGGHFFK
jgi:hypothetical protein